MKPWVPFGTDRFQGKRLLWYFNVHEEEKSGDELFPAVRDDLADRIAQQQEHQLIYPARPEDAVFIHRMPETPYLEHLRKLKGSLPELICADHLQAVPNLEKFVLVPFVMSTEIEEIRRRVPGLEVIGARLEVSRKLNNKYQARRFAEQNGFRVTTRFFCRDASELAEAYQKLRDMGFNKCVVKAPYGSSGKGLKMIHDPKNFQYFLRYVQSKKKAFELLLEGWHPHKISLSTQLFISDAGVEILAVTEQMIDPNGVYKGTNFTPRLTDEEMSLCRDAMIKCGTLMRRQGYTGIAGIDSIVDVYGRFIPIVEINARLTQVTYALPLAAERMERFRHIQSKIVVFASRNDLSFEELNRDLQRVFREENGEVVIYNFCKSGDANRFDYKLFLLVSARDRDQADEMIRKIEELRQKWIFSTECVGTHDAH